MSSIEGQTSTHLSQIMKSSQNNLIDKLSMKKKDKIPISLIPLPYCNENKDLSDLKQCNPKRLLKKMQFIFQEKIVSKSLKKKKDQKKKQKQLNQYQTPINEFLNYDLSHDINQGIKQAQFLAEQIKSIKQLKRQLNNKSPHKKQSKNKIKHMSVKNIKGLYMTQIRPI